MIQIYLWLAGVSGFWYYVFISNNSEGKEKKEQRKNGRYFHLIIKLEDNQIGLKFYDWIQ
jgi:hypothetical protein